jgi:hypothetical protein
MKKYRVFVRGENFLMDFDNKEQKIGFYTTVFIEAHTEEAAELEAMDLLRHDPMLVSNVLNAKADPPMMFADEIEELESFEGLHLPRLGFSFFTDEEETGDS